MKLIKVLSVLTVSALAVTATAAPTTGGKGGGKEGRSGVKGKEDVQEQQQRSVGERMASLKSSPEGVKALEVASQIVTKRPAAANSEAVVVGLAEGILSGAVARNEMLELAESVQSSTVNKNIADGLYTAAANNLISRPEQVVITVKDANGKDIQVNTLNAFFNHGKSVAKGEWQNNTAAARFAEFSQKIESSIRERTANSWLDAARRACEELGIKWEDFVKLCLLK